MGKAKSNKNMSSRLFLELQENLEFHLLSNCRKIKSLLNKYLGYLPFLLINKVIDIISLHNIILSMAINDMLHSVQALKALTHRQTWAVPTGMTKKMYIIFFVLFFAFCI